MRVQKLGGNDWDGIVLIPDDHMAIAIPMTGKEARKLADQIYRLLGDEVLGHCGNKDGDQNHER